MSSRTLWCIPLVALLACTHPTLNPRLNPSGSAVRWDRGLGFLEQSQDGLTLGVAHLRSGRGSLEFLVEVTNHGSDPVTLVPEEILCSLEAPITHRNIPKDVKAQDPEATLRTLQENKALEQKIQARASGASAFFLFVDLADSLSNDRNRSPQERFRGQRDKGDFVRDRELENREAEEAEARIDERLATESSSLLRKHQIQPGQRLRGRVDFYVQANGFQQLRLQIPLGGRMFTFLFKPA